MALLSISRWSQEVLTVLKTSFKKITSFIIPQMSYNVIFPFQKTGLSYIDISKSIQKTNIEANSYYTII